MIARDELMDRLKQRSIDEIRSARENLLAINKNTLTFASINDWFKNWYQPFTRSETLSGNQIRWRIGVIIQGYEAETDVDILSDLSTAYHKCFPSLTKSTREDILGVGGESTCEVPNPLIQFN